MTTKRALLRAIWQFGVQIPLGAAVMFSLMLKQPIWYLYPRMLFGCVIGLTVPYVVAEIRARRPIP